MYRSTIVPDCDRSTNGAHPFSNFYNRTPPMNINNGNSDANGKLMVTSGHFANGWSAAASESASTLSRLAALISGSPIKQKTLAAMPRSRSSSNENGHHQQQQAQQQDDESIIIAEVCERYRALSTNLRLILLSKLLQCSGPDELFKLQTILDGLLKCDVVSALPQVALERILCFLDAGSVHAAMSVCRTWHTRITACKSLWQRLCFQLGVVPERLSEQSASDMRSLYVTVRWMQRHTRSQSQAPPPPRTPTSPSPHSHANAFQFQFVSSKFTFPSNYNPAFAAPSTLAPPPSVAAAAAVSSSSRASASAFAPASAAPAAAAVAAAAAADSFRFRATSWNTRQHAARPSSAFLPAAATAALNRTTTPQSQSQSQSNSRDGSCAPAATATAAEASASATASLLSVSSHGGTKSGFTSDRLAVPSRLLGLHDAARASSVPPQPQPHTHTHAHTQPLSPLVQHSSASSSASFNAATQSHATATATATATAQADASAAAAAAATASLDVPAPPPPLSAPPADACDGDGGSGEKRPEPLEAAAAQRSGRSPGVGVGAGSDQDVFQYTYLAYHTDRITVVHYNQQLQLVATGSDDRTVCIYTADTLTRRKQFYVGHTVADLKLSACYFLCGSFNCLLTLWYYNLTDGASPELQCLCSCIGHTKGVLSVDLSLQLELAVSGAADETVKFWWLPELALPTPSASSPAASSPEALAESLGLGSAATGAGAGVASGRSNSSVGVALEHQHRSASPVITIDSVGAIVQKIVIDPSSVCIENVRAHDTRLGIGNGLDDAAGYSSASGTGGSGVPVPVRRMSFSLLIATEKLVTLHQVALLQRATAGGGGSSTLELLSLDTLLTISSEQLLSGFYLDGGSLVGITRELQSLAPALTSQSLAPVLPSVLLSPTSPTSRVPSLLMSPPASSSSSASSASRTQQLRRCSINYSTMQSQANFSYGIGSGGSSIQNNNNNSGSNSNNNTYNSSPNANSDCTVTRSTNHWYTSSRGSASATSSPDETDAHHCIVKRANLRPSVSMIAVSGCDRHNPPLQLPAHLQQTSNSSLYSSLVHLYSGSVYTLLLAEILDSGAGNYSAAASGAMSSSMSSSAPSAWNNCGRISPAHFGAGAARNGSGAAAAAQSPSCAAQLLFFTKYARTPVLSVPIFDRLFRWGSRMRSATCALADASWLDAGLSLRRLEQLHRERALLFLAVTSDHRLLAVRWAAPTSPSPAPTAALSAVS